MSLISTSSLNLSNFLTGPNFHFYHRNLNICKCRAPLSQPYFRPPSSCLFHEEEIIVEGGGDIGDERKGLRLKWHDVGSDLSEAQKDQISQLSPTTSNRCKAIMRRIICFSQEENLFMLLASWVKAMQPRRCDWLSVLKEIKRMDVSLFFEVKYHLTLPLE